MACLTSFHVVYFSVLLFTVNELVIMKCLFNVLINKIHMNHVTDYVAVLVEAVIVS